MFTSTYTAIENAADRTFRTTIVAIAECEPIAGCYPTAWVILTGSIPARFGEGTMYSVNRAIMPTIGVGEIVQPCYFDSGSYNLDREGAFHIFRRSIG